MTIKLTTRPKVYIAGPMRGHQLYNFPLFDSIRDQLANAGFQPISPADLDRKYGFDPHQLPDDHDWNTLPDGLDIKDVADRDLSAILGCDAIYKLPGWQKSAGARAEVAVAEWLGLEDVTKQESIAAEADRIVDADRGNDYGHPLDDFAKTAVFWSLILGIQVTPEQVGLCMIGVKMSREINRPKRDNRVDIAGYAKTVDMVHAERDRRIAERQANGEKT